MRPLHALIVDEDPFMVRLIENVIAQRYADRIQLDTTTEVAVARDWLHERQYELLIADLTGTTCGAGLELVQHARAQNPWTRITVITGHPSIEQIREALALGACDYLFKPLNPTQLLEVIEQQVSQQKRWQKSGRECLQLLHA